MQRSFTRVVATLAAVLALVIITAPGAAHAKPVTEEGAALAVATAKSIGITIQADSAGNETETRNTTGSCDFAAYVGKAKAACFNDLDSHPQDDEQTV